MDNNQCPFALQILVKFTVNYYIKAFVFSVGQGPKLDSAIREAWKAMANGAYC